MDEYTKDFIKNFAKVIITFLLFIFVVFGTIFAVFGTFYVVFNKDIHPHDNTVKNIKSFCSEEDRTNDFGRYYCEGKRYTCNKNKCYYILEE